MVFLYGAYFLAMEGLQLFKLGLTAYFDSFWNFVDLASFVMAMMIPPFVLFRIGLTANGYVPIMVSGKACTSDLLMHGQYSSI
jgi:hypothetical protein